MQKKKRKKSKKNDAMLGFLFKILTKICILSITKQDYTHKLKIARHIATKKQNRESKQGKSR